MVVSLLCIAESSDWMDWTPVVRAWIPPAKVAMVTWEERSSLAMSQPRAGSPGVGSQQSKLFKTISEAYLLVLSKFEEDWNS